MSVRNFIASSFTLQGAMYIFFSTTFRFTSQDTSILWVCMLLENEIKHWPGFHSNLETPVYSACSLILMNTEKFNSISNAGNVRIVHVSFGCISTSARLIFDLLPVVSHALISHAPEVTIQNFIRALQYFFWSCVRSSKTELSETLSYR